jgi:hypothetical protein
MTEKAKHGIVRGFFTNPLSYISFIILILTFVYNLGGGVAKRDDNSVIIKNQVQQVQNQMSTIILFQQRDSVHFYDWKVKEERKIDSVITVFGVGIKQIKHMSVSQDSLKAYFIRKAVTKQDMKDIYNIWNKNDNY